MNWTTNYPTKPGFYWIRDYDIKGMKEHPMLSTYDGPLIVAVIQTTYRSIRALEFMFHNSRHYFTRKDVFSAEWQGPIEPDI